MGNGSREVVAGVVTAFMVPVTTLPSGALTRSEAPGLGVPEP